MTVILHFIYRHNIETLVYREKLHKSNCTLCTKCFYLKIDASFNKKGKLRFPKLFFSSAVPFVSPILVED